MSNTWYIWFRSVQCTPHKGNTKGHIYHTFFSKLKPSSNSFSELNVFFIPLLKFFLSVSTRIGDRILSIDPATRCFNGFDAKIKQNQIRL